VITGASGSARLSATATVGAGAGSAATDVVAPADAVRSASVSALVEVQETRRRAAFRSAALRRIDLVMTCPSGAVVLRDRS
jgi:hypothetical protein